MGRLAYSYSILRYVHDSFSGECLNVGVVLCSQDGRIEVRTPSSFGRLKRAFPTANTNTIRSSLENFSGRLNDVVKTESDFQKALISALPEDEARLRASTLGVGLTAEFERTAEELLERFVLRCEYDFEEAELTQNRDFEGVWYARGSFVLCQSSNDNTYRLADVQQLRA